MVHFSVELGHQLLPRTAGRRGLLSVNILQPTFCGFVPSWCAQVSSSGVSVGSWGKLGSGTEIFKGPAAFRMSSWAARLTALLLYASRDSPFSCPLQRMMATLFSSHTASSRGKISASFFTSFLAEVKSLHSHYSAPCTRVVTNAYRSCAWGTETEDHHIVMVRIDVLY